MLTRTCPVCGGPDAEPALQKETLRLVRCRRCAMVYASPVAAEYASGQFYHDASAYYLSPAKLEGDYSPVRFERELRWFRRFCEAGSVLDVGCSSGAFLFHLRQRHPGAYHVLGTDASGPTLDYAASRRVPTWRGDFLAPNFPAGPYDAITFWAVLEHVAEPRRFLDQAASLLKPGGLCFVLVPNFRSLATRWLGARYRYIYPQHLNYFTAGTLRRLVHDRFEVRALGTTHFNPIVLWRDWRQGGRDVSNAERAALLQRTTAYKQRAAFKPLKLLYRLTEGALGACGLADNLIAVLHLRPRS